MMLLSRDKNTKKIFKKTEYKYWLNDEHCLYLDSWSKLQLGKLWYRFCSNG